jgi:hypothetical protein
MIITINITIFTTITSTNTSITTIHDISTQLKTLMKELHYTIHVNIRDEVVIFLKISGDGFRVGCVPEDGRPIGDSPWDSSSNSCISKMETGFVQNSISTRKQSPLLSVLCRLYKLCAAERNETMICTVI